MSDEPNPNASPGGGDAPKKRRRRRRRNKNKSPQNESAQASADQTADSDTSAPEKRQSQGDGQKPRGDRPPKAGNGYRGKTQKPNAGSRSGNPKRDGSKNRDESKGKSPRSSNGAPPDRPGQTAAKPKAKKRRKPRTKQCVNCYTPCTTIHRVRLDYRKQWVFICDICWPTRCIDNPHYEFGGTWVSGRIVKPESQQRDEWLAKQKQKKSNQSASHDKPNEDRQPKANHDAAASPPPDAAAPSEGEPNDNQHVEIAESPAASVEVSTHNEAPPTHDQTPDESQPSDGHAAADPPTEEGQGG